MPRKKKTTDEQLADAELEAKKLIDSIKKKNEQLKIIENRKNLKMVMWNGSKIS